MSRYEWDGTNSGVETLKEAIEPSRQKVLGHPVYHQLNSVDAVVTFMEHHVFAVWDFMSLLKSLQRRLTCVEVPWLPSAATGSRRLINDIVLVEESDELGEGFISHFELYLDGMRQSGADTTRIDTFIALLRQGRTVPAALKEAGVPRSVTEFVGTTWELRTCRSSMSRRHWESSQRGMTTSSAPLARSIAAKPSGAAWYSGPVTRCGPLPSSPSSIPDGPLAAIVAPRDSWVRRLTPFGRPVVPEV